MAYASPATYIFLEHRDKYPYKTTATYIVFDHNDIMSNSNHREYIVFITQIDVKNETDIPRLGTSTLIR
jgi:hypothetical protein